MAKPEWGLKRTCQSCGIRFYDLQRDPILCPSCDATFDPDRIVRSRRSSVAKPVAKPEKKEPKVVAVEPADDLDALTSEADDEIGENGDLMEDASDLGDDSGDMAEVMENVEDTFGDKE